MTILNMLARRKLRPLPMAVWPICLLMTACGGTSSAPANVAGVADATVTSDTPVPAPCTLVNALSENEHLITSWRTAPGDALVTQPISGLSVRQSFAPHWSGERVRLRLSNRYSATPLTVQSVHIARELVVGGPEMVAGSECLLRFDGQTTVTIPPGETVVSDLVAYPVRAFERVGISFHAPEQTPQITRHLSANEFLYISVPGDYAAEPGGNAYRQVTDGYASNFLAIEALEVAAPLSVTTLVAVGDSITDGSDSTTSFIDGEPSPLTGKDQRYPNHLQRLIRQARLPLSVANAGIGGNELLNDGYLPQFGRRLLDRLDDDVLGVTGATQVLLMIGTNDFGNPKAGPTPTADELIDGLIDVINRVQGAGMSIILGTIPPAEGTVTAGLPGVGALPAGVALLHGTAQARAARDAVNDWIRQQPLSDGIVDFARCLEDPNRPGFIAPEYNSGDNLHPNPAGYAAMAGCVDLELLR